MLEDAIFENWREKYHSLTQVFQDLYSGPFSRPLVDGKDCVFYHVNGCYSWYQLNDSNDSVAYSFVTTNISSLGMPLSLIASPTSFSVP